MSDRPQHIVIVDDDVDHAVIARLVLGQIAPDMAVEIITDSRFLIDRLLDVPQDALLLVDRTLDRVDGIAVIASLSRRRADLRCIAVSAAMDEHDRTRALEAGAEAAYEKPSTVAGWHRLFASILGADEATAWWAA